MTNASGNARSSSTSPRPTAAARHPYWAMRTNSSGASTIGDAGVGARGRAAARGRGEQQPQARAPGGGAPSILGDEDKQQGRQHDRGRGRRRLEEADGRGA